MTQEMHQNSCIFTNCPLPYLNQISILHSGGFSKPPQRLKPQAIDCEYACISRCWWLVSSLKKNKHDYGITSTTYAVHLSIYLYIKPYCPIINQFIPDLLVLYSIEPP